MEITKKNSIYNWGKSRKYQLCQRAFVNRESTLFCFTIPH